MILLKNTTARDIKEQISLFDMLGRLGYHPLMTSGKELLYLSMIRDSDTQPSFAVNDNLGLWYDHGLGKGGDIIDFGIAYWKTISFPEVLEKILQVMGNSIPAGNNSTENKCRQRKAIKIPNYQIQEIKEIGNNPAISAYLQSRKVWQVARNRLMEVYYYVEDQKKLRKYFFAAGWQNELGAWEVRNLYFKGCLGHKALSFIPGDENKLSVFEGYLNYLSWLTENPLAADSILVLNTISLLEAGTRKARDFDAIDLFFDRDSAGHKASLDFKKAVPQAIDCSGLYRHYNDYNDRLIAKANNEYPGII